MTDDRGARRPREHQQVLILERLPIPAIESLHDDVYRRRFFRVLRQGDSATPEHCGERRYSRADEIHGRPFIVCPFTVNDPATTAIG
jgi:hypothetical protein